MDKIRTDPSFDKILMITICYTHYTLFKTKMLSKQVHRTTFYPRFNKT